jgi:hypothetical protein
MDESGWSSDSEDMPPMDPSSLLLELERRRLRALVEGDLEVAEQLHADDYQLITPGGGAVSKREYLDGIASGELNYRVFEVASEVAVKTFDGVGMVRYLARIEIDFPDGRDGGTFWHTDIYERRDRNWQVVWSQGTHAPDAT